MSYVKCLQNKAYIHVAGEPAPDYELICRASGGHAERVEDPAQLPDAIRRALRVVQDEHRQALLNVICKKP